MGSGNGTKMTVSRPLHGVRNLAVKVAAEYCGTFAITLVAIGVDVLYYTGAGVDYTARWLARGFITTAVIYSLSSLSGAHIDPAVSLAFAIRRTLPALQMLWYWLAQFAGGFTAAALAFALWKGNVVLGASHPSPPYTQFEAVIAEVVVTLILVTVILATAKEEAAIGRQAALAVGLTVAACGFFAGPISGASMNPARSIPPQLLGGASQLAWIYVAGPLLGATLAALLVGFFFPRVSRGERKAGRGRV